MAGSGCGFSKCHDRRVTAWRIELEQVPDLPVLLDVLGLAGEGRRPNHPTPGPGRPDPAVQPVVRRRTEPGGMPPKSSPAAPCGPTPRPDRVSLGRSVEILAVSGSRAWRPMTTSTVAIDEISLQLAVSRGRRCSVAGRTCPVGARADLKAHGVAEVAALATCLSHDEHLPMACFDVSDDDPTAMKSSGSTLRSRPSGSAR